MSYNDKHLRTILTRTKTVAIVGVSLNPTRPSFFVARYLNLKGFKVIPVNPVYAGQSAFGGTAVASLDQIDERVDMIDIFRRPSEAGAIVQDAISNLKDKGLETIWMQIGVINPQAEAVGLDAGLDVIMNRCPKIEYQRLFGELRWAGFNTGILTARLDR